MATAGLIDLPTELVLKIVHDPVLTQEDLYCIATLSQRLNTIVIPVLLDLTGLSEPHDTLKLILDNKSFSPFRTRPRLPKERKAVTQRAIPESSEDENSEEDVGTSIGLRLEPAIMVAFQLSTIHKLVCTLPQTFTDLTNLNLHLSRIHALLSRLESVGSVSFHFTGDHRYRHLKSNPLSAVPVAFADLFADIVRLLVSKGCKALLLYNNSEQLRDEYQSLLTGDERPSGSRRPIVPPTTSNLLPTPAPTKKRKEKKNLFSRAKSNFESAFSKQPILSESRKPHLQTSSNQESLYLPFDPSTIQHDSGKLETIHIQTPFALLPRCLPVIRESIHSSINTLTSITFSYIFFDETLFDSCLSSLCFERPNVVTHLRIHHCYNISPKSLISFLRCFRDRLEYLELDWNTAFIRDDEEIPPGGGLCFRNLKTIIAPLDWVAYFLRQPVDSSSSSTTSSLPKLSTMTIQCRLEDSTEFKYNTFAPHLDNILKPLYSRRISPSHQRKTPPKIDITLDLILDRNRPFELDLDTVIMNYTLKSPSPRVSDNDASTRSAPRPPKHWDLISKLNLSPTYPPVTETQAFALAQWVTVVFPAVEEVILPLPFIPRLMPIEKYKSRQRDLVVDAAVFLAEALRLWRVRDGVGEVKWKRLVVGPWRLSVEEE